MSASDTRWIQNGVTVAGGKGAGDEPNQISYPFGLYVDDAQTVYVTEWNNHRVVEWALGATSGQVVAGGNGQGSRMDQLDCPTNVIVDNKRDCLIICDRGNKRVVRWPRRGGTSGETIISNIDCNGLAMDNDGFLYVSTTKDNDVKRWRVGDASGTLVAGGNGRGDRLDQLNDPYYIFVDQNQSVYVSDNKNHRVMKWVKGEEEGIIVAGGQGQGNDVTQLSDPLGVIVDELGTVYVSDAENARIIRWRKGDTRGEVIVGGNGEGQQPNQLNRPNGLAFDQHGNLYVVEENNHRVQKFNIDLNPSS
jgi:sugar lactone lactonase YvrE